MGFGLKPRNKKVKEFYIGTFSWKVMLQDTGMGYVLGYGSDIEPGTYIYQSGNIGSPISHDGYKVSSFEAKAMALVARGYISVKRTINQRYNEMTEEEKSYHKNTRNFEGRKLYNGPVSEVFLLALERFAEFAENSGGFTIK